MRKLSSFFRLPLGQKKLICWSFVLIVAIRIGLWLLPFGLLSRLLNRFGTVEKKKTADWTTVQHIVRSVRISSRYVPGATCLTQALASRFLLRISGQASDLKIGVEKDENNRFGAHAWIEVDGRIVIGKLPRHHRFAVLNSN